MQYTTPNFIGRNVEFEEIHVRICTRLAHVADTMFDLIEKRMGAEEPSTIISERSRRLHLRDNLPLKPSFF